VEVKIDVDEMEGGKELIISLAEISPGLPWMAILAPDGTLLADSFAPNGSNIGFPQADWEIAHWNTMMLTTVSRITEEEVRYLARTLAEYGGDPGNRP